MGMMHGVLLEIRRQILSVKRVELFADAKKDVPRGGSQEVHTVHFLIGYGIERGLTSQLF